MNGLCFAELRPENQWILLPVVGTIKELNLEVASYTCEAHNYAP